MLDLTLLFTVIGIAMVTSALSAILGEMGMQSLSRLVAMIATAVIAITVFGKFTHLFDTMRTLFLL